jgi:hypothetical protein
MHTTAIGVADPISEALIKESEQTLNVMAAQLQPITDVIQYTNDNLLEVKQKSPTPIVEAKQKSSTPIVEAKQKSPTPIVVVTDESKHSKVNAKPSTIYIQPTRCYHYRNQQKNHKHPSK